MALVGCPFCRDLFSDDEGPLCPVCGVRLEPVEKLPLSYEEQAERAAALAATPPEHRTLPWSYLGRSRGALVALSMLGMGAFFAPWIALEKPELVTLSGFDLARWRAGWFWGGAVAWLMLFALVASRRTVAQMRGVRIVATAFAITTLLEVALLWLTAPEGTRYVPLKYRWGWGLYASALLSTAAAAFSVRFGGRVDEMEPGAPRGETPLAQPILETSDGQTLH